MNQGLALQLHEKYPATHKHSTIGAARRWPIVHERLGGVDIPLFVYSEYHAGQKAREPGSSVCDALGVRSTQRARPIRRSLAGFLVNLVELSLFFAIAFIERRATQWPSFRRPD